VAEENVQVGWGTAFGVAVAVTAVLVLIGYLLEAIASV
jgi:hypothetical protein